MSNTPLPKMRRNCKWTAQETALLKNLLKEKGKDEIAKWCLSGPWKRRWEYSSVYEKAKKLAPELFQKGETDEFLGGKNNQIFI